MNQEICFVTGWVTGGNLDMVMCSATPTFHTTKQIKHLLTLLSEMGPDHFSYPTLITNQIDCDNCRAALSL